MSIHKLKLLCPLDVAYMQVLCWVTYREAYVWKGLIVSLLVIN